MDTINCRICGNAGHVATLPDGTLYTYCQKCEVKTMQGEAKSKRSITEYELIDDGIEHAQYWRGCGIAFTKYKHVVTATGDNFAEAIDGCFDMIAEQHDNVDIEALQSLIMSDCGVSEWPTKPSVSGLSTDFADDPAEVAHYYYVSIRFNLPQ